MGGRVPTLESGNRQDRTDEHPLSEPPTDPFKDHDPEEMQQTSLTISFEPAEYFALEMAARIADRTPRDFVAEEMTDLARDRAKKR